MSFSKSNSSSTPAKAVKQYAKGRRDYRAGVRFNRLSNKDWVRGFLDARKEASGSRVGSNGPDAVAVDPGSSA